MNFTRENLRKLKAQFAAIPHSEMGLLAKKLLLRQIADARVLQSLNRKRKKA